MNKFLLLCLLSTSFFYISCHEASQEKSETPTSQSSPPLKEPSKDSTISLDTSVQKLAVEHFKKVPKEIEGCACYFSGTKERFDKQEYLFAANFDSVAYILINQKMQKLKLVSTTRKEGTFGAHDQVEVYSNGSYKATLNIKFIKTIDTEVWWNKGTITIEDKNKLKVVEQVVGECGC